jgi:hypothetical protein
MSDDDHIRADTGARPPAQSGAPAAPPAGPYPPAPSGPAAQATEGGRHGWLIALGVVAALAFGAFAAAIIAKGDDGRAATTTAPTKTVQSGTTTVLQKTTTVTTPAPNVTVAPDVTLDASGAVKSVPEEGTKTAAQGGSSTPASPTTPTTTSP